MKRKINSAICLLVLSLIFTACKFNDLTTRWQLSGTASFTGSNTSGDVKLAVFFAKDSSMDFNEAGALVSDVANLGKVAGTSFPFTLNINAPEIGPEMERAQLYLVMWEDLNNDNIYEYSGIDHFAHSEAGDPVFKTENEDYLTWDHGGHWYFEPVVNLNNGAQLGWNQRVGDSYVPIDQAQKSGARLVSSRNF